MILASACVHVTDSPNVVGFRLAVALHVLREETYSLPPGARPHSFQHAKSESRVQIQSSLPCLEYDSEEPGHIQFPFALFGMLGGVDGYLPYPVQVVHACVDGVLRVDVPAQPQVVHATNQLRAVTVTLGVLEYPSLLFREPQSQVVPTHLPSLYEVRVRVESMSSHVVD